jgi:ATP-binding protein involved in chromosome partitioning
LKRVIEASSFEVFEARRKARRIRRILLVGSGKGGVGKSLVACGLALRLSERGKKTGILDLDIHGSSVPAYFGIGPPVSSTKDGLTPKRIGNLKIMSIGLFTGDNPVPVRGVLKQDLVAQLFALTDWGVLDYLLVDLPPSTGDEVLSAFEIFEGKGELLLVTTPSKGAVDVVKRLARLAGTEHVPVLGAVLNMSFERTGRTKSHPFGRVNLDDLEASLGCRVLAEVPVEERINSDGLAEALAADGDFSEAFARLTAVVTSS